jgi:hypothetical protein
VIRKTSVANTLNDNERHSFQLYFIIRSGKNQVAFLPCSDLYFSFFNAKQDAAGHLCPTANLLSSLLTARIRPV